MATFDFSDSSTRLSALLALLEHWYGPRPEHAGFTADERRRAIDLDVPTPLYEFLDFTAHWSDRSGSWLWHHSVPQLLPIDAVRPSAEWSIIDAPLALAAPGDWLTIGDYLGVCEVRVPRGSADSPVIELDTEEAVYHDRVSEFLVRFALRNMMRSQLWAPIANYDQVIEEYVGSHPPLYDATWRLADPRDASSLLDPPFNSSQQTPTESVWLMEGGELLVHQHASSEQLTASARNHAVLDMLLERHGQAAASLLEITLAQHPDLGPRERWKLRVLDDGSATLALRILGMPQAAVPAGALDLDQLVSVLVSTGSADTDPLDASAVVVRGRGHSGDRFQPTSGAVALVVQAFLDAGLPRSAEFESAWARYGLDS